MFNAGILPALLFILNRIDIYFFILVVLLVLCLAAASYACLTGYEPECARYRKLYSAKIYRFNSYPHRGFIRR
jgi:hypothetical protein